MKIHEFLNLFGRITILVVHVIEIGRAVQDICQGLKYLRVRLMLWSRGLARVGL